ncbi:sodium:calcium antiporter [Patescibacteria group bacterium]
MIFFNFFIFIICLAVIIKSGTLLVKSLIKIARFLNLSEYVVAFILMAFATSVPELFVGITSAIKKVPIISFGNIIGANILNMTFAIGLVILVARGINITEQHIKKDAWLIFFMALLPVLLAFDGILSRLDGFILLILFIWYITRLLGRREHFDEKLNNIKNNRVGLREFLKNLELFFIGLVLLLVASWGLVESSSLIAIEAGFSLAIIGLILIAIGTTLPEVSFGIRSVLLKHEKMTVGNFLGSVAFNSLVVLGLTAVICPFKVDIRLALMSILFLSLSLLIFNIFVRTKKRLSYREGIILLMLYGLFLITTIFIG